MYVVGTLLDTNFYIIMGLNSFISSIFGAKSEDFYLELHKTIDSSGITQVCVDSDNFDVKIEQSDNPYPEYKLFIKEGFKFSDMTLVENVNSTKMSFSLKSRKNNMSGILELLVPKSTRDFEIVCQNGDITISEISIDRMNLKTTNGDIEAKTKKEKYYIICHTTNGDISNKLPSFADSVKMINCSTVNGDIIIK